MRVRLFLVPVLLFALSTCCSFAQVNRPIIKSKPDAPLQITEAHCGQNPPGSPAEGTSYCHATLQFVGTDDTWDGYGLRWILTFEDGKKYPHYHRADRSLPQPFQPREIVDVGGNGEYGWTWFSTKDRNGKTLRLTDAEVEVEFVINTNGTVWGDSKSPRYLQMYLQMLQFRLIDAIENAKRMPRKD